MFHADNSRDFARLPYVSFRRIFTLSVPEYPLLLIYYIMEAPITTTSNVGGRTINTAYSGSIPENYDKYLGPLFFEPYAIEVGTRIAALRPLAVLELACGTGRVTKHLLAACAPGGKVIATDINPAMLSEARRNVPSSTIEWNTVDAVALPYADASFDAIVCQFGVMFLSNRVKAYSEAHRVLKPGGTLLVSSWDALEFNPIEQLTDALLHEFFPEDTPQFYSIPFAYNNESVMRRELQQSGFSDISIERVKLEGSGSSPEDAAIGLLEGIPVVGEILARDPTALPIMEKRLASDIAARFGRGKIVAPMQAWFITARR